MADRGRARRGRRPADRGPQPVPRRGAGRRHAGRASCPPRSVARRSPATWPRAGRPRACRRARPTSSRWCWSRSRSPTSRWCSASWRPSGSRCSAPRPSRWRSARPIDRIAKVSRPVIWLLSVSTNVVVRLLGGDPNAKSEQMTDEELRELVDAHETLGEEERRIVEDVFEAGDRQIREVMIPRTEVDFLDASTPVYKAAREALHQPHSRYPVIRGLRRRRDRLRARARPARPRDGQPLAAGRRAGPRRPWCCPGPGRSWPRWPTCAARACTSRSSPTSTAAPPASSRMEDLVEELIGDIKDEYDVDEAETTRAPRRRRRGRRAAQPRRLRGRDRRRAARGPLRDGRRLPHGSSSAGSRRSATRSTSTTAGSPCARSRAAASAGCW